MLQSPPKYLFSIEIEISATVIYWALVMTLVLRGKKLDIQNDFRIRINMPKGNFCIFEEK